MTDNENLRIKELIKSSRNAAASEMDAIKTADTLTREFFDDHFRSYVLYKYLLKNTKLETDNFNELTDISLSNSMKISKDLVKEFDLAKSCDGGSSAMAKKVLLFLAIQKELNITIPARESARITTLQDLSDLIWYTLAADDNWKTKLA